MTYTQYRQFRESAMQWLHAAPADWRDSPFGYLFREIEERRGARSDLPLLSVTISRGVVPRSELNDGKEARADDFSNYKICTSNDIVLNRMRAFQGGLGIGWGSPTVMA